MENFSKRKIANSFFNLLCISFFGVVSCNNTSVDKTDSIGVTKIEIPTKEIYLDKVEIHSKTEAKFKIINSGKQPLLISRIEADCSCTNVFAEKERISMGDSTFIHVTYNAKIYGYFMQNILFSSNTDEKIHILSIKGKTE